MYEEDTFILSVFYENVFQWLYNIWCNTFILMHCIYLNFFNSNHIFLFKFIKIGIVDGCFKIRGDCGLLHSLGPSHHYKWPSFVPFYDWVLSHCIYVPRLLNPFIWQWTYLNYFIIFSHHENLMFVLLGFFVFIVIFIWTLFLYWMFIHTITYCFSIWKLFSCWILVHTIT